MTRLAALLAASLLTLQVTACKPQIIREPYMVETVREVVIPQPEEFTKPLVTPTLPVGPLLIVTLVEHIKAWQAFGKTANDHRGRVGELSEGQGK